MEDKSTKIDARLVNRYGKDYSELTQEELGNALYMATINNDAFEVGMLLDAGAPVNQQPHIAGYNGMTEIIELFERKRGLICGPRRVGPVIRDGYEGPLPDPQD